MWLSTHSTVMTQQVSVAISTLGGTSLTILPYIAKYNVFDTRIQFKDITGEKKKKVLWSNFETQAFWGPWMVKGTLSAVEDEKCSGLFQCRLYKLIFKIFLFLFMYFMWKPVTKFFFTGVVVISLRGLLKIEGRWRKCCFSGLDLFSLTAR